MTYHEPLTPDADRLLTQLASEDVSGPNIELLLNEVWKVFNGAEGLARALFDDYQAAPPGSATRARISADIMKLVHTFSKAYADEESSGSELEDMEAEVKKQLAVLSKDKSDV
jgi:hypothetical protein